MIASAHARGEFQLFSEGKLLTVVADIVYSQRVIRSPLVRTSERNAGCGDGPIRWPMFQRAGRRSALHPRLESAPARDARGSKHIPVGTLGNFLRGDVVPH